MDDFKPIDIKQVEKLIMNLKTSNSYGYDTISRKVLKDSLSILLPSIHHIFNLSLLQKKYPNKWKISAVRKMPKNFCPVSQISSISKALEEVD